MVFSFFFKQITALTCVCLYLPWLTKSVSRSQPSGATNQATELQKEGIEVTRSAMGEYTIDLEVYGWFPEELAEEE